MAKASINTGVDAQAVHTRTTAGVEESQVVVLGIDGSDGVVSATVADGLMVDLGANNDIRGTSLTVSGSGSALNATPIPSTDVSDYRFVGIQVTGTFNLVMSFDCSNDGVNWISQGVGLQNSGAGDYDTFSQSVGNFVFGALPGKFFRTKITSYTSGTIDVVAFFSAIPGAAQVRTISAEILGQVEVIDGGTPLGVTGSFLTDADLRADPLVINQGGGGDPFDPWPVAPQLATAGAVTSVNDSAANQTLLAASASRRGFRIFNDSTSALHVKYGATATVTDFTEKIAAAGMLREDNYSGRVDGIWAADSSGAARITELT